MYAGDKYFQQAYEYLNNPTSYNGNLYAKYFMKDGYFFKGWQLCILDYAMRENIIKELYSGALGGHFDRDKTVALVEDCYYYLRLRK